MKKRILTILILALTVIALLCACGKVEDQVITSNGMSMTIPGNMKKDTTNTNYTFVYSNNKEAIIGLYEDSALFAEYGLDPTVEEYCELVLAGNGFDTTPTEINGLLTFTHESTVNGVDYSYLSAVYKSETGFWLIQCGTLSDEFQDHYDNFLTYLGSVQP